MANENEPPTGSELHSHSSPGRPTKRLALGRESRAQLLRDLIAGNAAEEVNYAPGSPSSYRSPDGVDATELQVLYRIVSAAVYSLSAAHVPTVAMMETYLQRVCLAFAVQARFDERYRAECVNGVPGFSRIFRNTVGIGTIQVDGNTLEVKKHIEMIPPVFDENSTLVAHTQYGPSPVVVTDFFDSFKPYYSIGSYVRVAHASLLRDVVASYTRTAEIVALDYGVQMIRARLCGGEITGFRPRFEPLWPQGTDGIDRAQAFPNSVVSLFEQAAGLGAGGVEEQGM